MTLNVSADLPKHYSSGGLIIHNDKLLLIHWDKPRDSYDFPKGTIEPGETPEVTCIREVLEETGYKTKIVSLIGTNEFDFQTMEGEWKRKHNTYYLLQLEDETIYATHREPHETFQNVWVPLNKAEAIITRDINIEIFKKATQLYLHSTEFGV